MSTERGWDVFTSSGRGTLEIQREDELDMFPDDDAAALAAFQAAMEGDAYAREAIICVLDQNFERWEAGLAKHAPGGPTMNLDNRETATVLAALRYWQREGWRSEGHEHAIASDGGIEPLTAAEIDALCERLNVGEAPEPAESAYSCTRCGSHAMQVSMPGWYRPDDLTHIDVDGEAEPLSYFCEDCGDTVTVHHQDGPSPDDWAHRSGRWGGEILPTCDEDEDDCPACKAAEQQTNQGDTP